jgi:hypothetical protein
MNAHYVFFLFIIFFGVKSLEFVSSILFGTGGPIANATASRMLGYGT